MYGHGRVLVTGASSHSEGNADAEGSQVPELRQAHASAVHHQPAEVLELRHGREEGSGPLNLGAAAAETRGPMSSCRHCRDPEHNIRDMPFGDAGKGTWFNDPDGDGRASGSIARQVASADERRPARSARHGGSLSSPCGMSGRCLAAPTEQKRATFGLSAIGCRRLVANFPDPVTHSGWGAGSASEVPRCGRCVPRPRLRRATPCRPGRPLERPIVAVSRLPVP